MNSMNDAMVEKMEAMTTVAMTSMPFAGEVVNAGKVVLSKMGKKITLTLSEDFIVPATPDPHWQVVDQQGNAYLLNRLKIEGDRVNRTIVLPAYITGVAMVQVWCGFAEAVLGEAKF